MMILMLASGILDGVYVCGVGVCVCVCALTYVFMCVHACFLLRILVSFYLSMLSSVLLSSLDVGPKRSPVLGTMDTHGHTWTHVLFGCEMLRFIAVFSSVTDFLSALFRSSLWSLVGPPRLVLQSSLSPVSYPCFSLTDTTRSSCPSHPLTP